MIHYEQAGRGQPVLLLHSFPFDSRIWASTFVEYDADFGTSAPLS